MKPYLFAICLLANFAAAHTASAGALDLTVKDAGAVADGTTLNTSVIQATIDAIAARGGGTLTVPSGVYLTGALFLKAGVNLHLDKGAVLKGSANIDDYPSMTTRIEGHTQVWRPALVNADHADHLRITGPGMIQGGGKPFWTAFQQRIKADRKTTNLDVDRPRNLFIRDSKDVTLSGFSLRDSGFWNIHLYRCQNVVVENLDIETPSGAPSTDGIDVDSDQDVEIRHCRLSVDDDDIALKGNKGPLSVIDAENPAVERIHIHDCTFNLGHGVLTVGSEACLVRDVEMDHCTVEGPGTSKTTLLRLKLRPDSPETYENIRVHDIKLNGSGGLISIEPWMQYFDLKGQEPPAQLVDNITMSRVSGTFGKFGRIAGPEKSTIKNVTMENIDVQLKAPRATAAKVENLKVQNVKINGQPLAL